jgi:SAM-dependent methyltransferase
VEADEGFFGERVAAFYDERSADASRPEVVGPVVDMLAGFAEDGAALEFGIGTGRIAIPLAEKGVRVVGIDNSDAMLLRLRRSRKLRVSRRCWGTSRPLVWAGSSPSPTWS